MPDDLVKRICQQWIDAGYADECFWEVWPGDPEPEDSLTPRMVLDRIEILKAENHLLKTSGIIEVASRNPNVMEYMRHWEGRAEAAEAKLAEAVDFVRRTIRHAGNSGDDFLADKARTTLAQLTGGTDAKD